MAQPDYSQPLATLVRTSTTEVHDAISNSPNAQLLTTGGLSKDEYVRFLMMLWHVYSTLEQALDQHASHPALESTYNPALLARTPGLSADISYLLQVPEDAWKSHPMHVNLMENTPPALEAYLVRIRELAGSNATALLSHAYVRYLGDLSGGQIIRYAVAKSYGLQDQQLPGAKVSNESASGSSEPAMNTPGVSFYAFKSLHSTKPANLGEIKRIKEWFKDGINKAGEKMGVEGKRAIITEVKKVYDLNAALFECLSVPPSLSSQRGNTVNSSSSPITGPFGKNSGSRMSIFMVFLAVSLAHVVWSTSTADLFRFEQWIASFLTA